MSPEESKIADELANLLARYSELHEPAAGFICLLVPPGGLGGVVSNLSREGTLEVLEQYVAHHRRSGATH